jgi:hypothetical protein
MIAINREEASMGRIDKELALEMMLSGESDRKIGERFGTSRQAVNLLRKTFIKDGKLTAAGQTFKQVDNTSILTENSEGPVPLPASEVSKTKVQQQPTPYPTLEQLTEWMINIIKDAGDTSLLRQENKVMSVRVEELQIKLKELQEELKQVNAQLLTVTENTRRYETVIRKLGLPPPGTR